MVERWTALLTAIGCTASVTDIIALSILNREIAVRLRAMHLALWKSMSGLPWSDQKAVQRFCWTAEHQLLGDVTLSRMIGWSRFLWISASVLIGLVIVFATNGARR